jgi:hypothetical protein
MTSDSRMPTPQRGLAVAAEAALPSTTVQLSARHDQMTVDSPAHTVPSEPGCPEGKALPMGPHTLPPTHSPSLVYATCTEYRKRLGWPVRVDENEQYVELLTGEALVGGRQSGGRIVLVDMPAGLGGRVSSVLWARNLTAVVFATIRQLYIHPYRQTRWCYPVLADHAKHFDGRAGRPIPLLDVQVVKNTAVSLPLLNRTDREATPDHQLGNGLPGPCWMQPPSNDAERTPLPRLTAVLAAICEAVTNDQQRRPPTSRAGGAR